MNRNGLSGESVLFALIGSGTDDLTLLVFSSKPCWMTLVHPLLNIPLLSSSDESTSTGTLKGWVFIDSIKLILDYPVKRHSSLLSTASTTIGTKLIKN
jgi:hypothetical protein